jgi:hypothetical protein
MDVSDISRRTGSERMGDLAGLGGVALLGGIVDQSGVEHESREEQLLNTLCTKYANGLDLHWDNNGSAKIRREKHWRLV